MLSQKTTGQAESLPFFSVTPCTPMHRAWPGPNVANSLFSGDTLLPAPYLTGHITSVTQLGTTLPPHQKPRPPRSPRSQELPALPLPPAKPPAKCPLQGTPGPKYFLTQVSLFQTPKPSSSRASAIQELRSRINGNLGGKLTPRMALTVPSPSTFPSKRETCKMPPHSSSSNARREK